jgi:hypothetical protein
MRNLTVEPERFSEYFGLNKTQDQIDFLDIYAYRDIPLFLDPYGISVMNSKWSKECEEHIAIYFQYLIESIQKNEKTVVDKLLNALHEVNEIALGYSSSKPKGRGIGKEHAIQLKKAFEGSKAAISGDIRDIADCALLIPNINRDKISDITANILKIDLIKFTQDQCDLHKIPMRRVAIDNAFDFKEFKFKSFYDKLPVIDDKAKILLPISSVRRDPELDKYKYYRNFILEYLKAEHMHPSDSLTYVLKNGRMKINIADLKARYPMSVNYIYKFSKEHPHILERFKSELRRTAKKPGAKPELGIKPKLLTARERIKILADIQPGNENANNFHKIIFNSLIYIFDERVSNPFREKDVNERRKRIDIVFDNCDKNGFFYKLNILYKIMCPKIIIECKNYGREIGNPEIDQLQGRLNNRRGMFGILVCRSIEDRKKSLMRCKDVMNDGKGYIIILDDSDISVLLEFKEKNNEKGIDDYLLKKYDELIM